jgi:hypothetical protein
MVGVARAVADIAANAPIARSAITGIARHFFTVTSWLLPETLGSSPIGAAFFEALTSIERRA